MSLQIQKGTVNVTGNVSSTPVVKTVTSVTSRLAAGGATNQTIATVTAGKSWKILSLTVSAGANTAIGADAYIYDGTSTQKYAMVAVLGLAGSCSANSTTITWPYGQGPVFAANSVIQIVISSNAITAAGSISYVEE
jgi:hypothetical protein